MVDLAFTNGEFVPIHSPTTSTIIFHPQVVEEILRIEPTGRIFWMGREVKGDEEFRAAMMDLSRKLK